MTDMRKLDVITTLYTLSIMIPYFVLMIKFNKKVAWLLYYIETIFYIATLYYVHTNFIAIPMYKILMDAAAVLGAYFLIWAGVQIKYAETPRRVEASVIMMLVSMFVFCVTNTAIILPAFIVWFVVFTWNRYYGGIQIMWVRKLKERFTLTKYSLEKARQAQLAKSNEQDNEKVELIIPEVVNESNN